MTVSVVAPSETLHAQSFEVLAFEGQWLDGRLKGNLTRPLTVTLVLSGLR